MNLDRPLPNEPLMTPQEAAAKLNMSVKQLMNHVNGGTIRFINIASPGSTRKRYRFTSYNLKTFLENQKERQQWQSTNKANITVMTSSTKGIDFMALAKPPIKKKHTR